MKFQRFRALATLVSSALILSSCMLLPGTFTSELELHRDGTFTYRYDGEIYLTAMSQLAEAGSGLGSDDEESEFIPQPCYVEEEWVEDDMAEAAAEAAEEAIDEVEDATDAAEEADEESENTETTVGIAVAVADEDENFEDDYAFEERECTEEEIADQREAYDARVEAKRKEAEQQAAIMALFFGGLDPSDPEAADELVKRLQRQRGWKTVENKGEGLFEVSYEITANMGHDFVFPTFERFPLNNFILTAAVREPNTIRIDAPGFAVQGGNGPLGGMMSGMIGVMQIMGDEEDKDAIESLPELDGTFALITDGRILANNTDEGPEEVDGMQRLEWVITPRTQIAPMALIALD